MEPRYHRYPPKVLAEEAKKRVAPKLRANDSFSAGCRFIGAASLRSPCQIFARALQFLVTKSRAEFSAIPQRETEAIPQENCKEASRSAFAEANAAARAAVGRESV